MAGHAGSVDLLARQWGTPDGGPNGMAVAAAYLATTLEGLGYAVRRLPGPLPDFTADLTITTIAASWRRLAEASRAAGATDRVVYWHHHGGIPDHAGFRVMAAPVFAPDIALPPSSWAVEDATQNFAEGFGWLMGGRILVPGAGMMKGARTARAVAEQCPDLRWYVLRGRCSHEDVNAWANLPAEVAPAVVPPAIFLARARAVLAPTRAETYGLTLVEAAVRGIPVVCSDLPELRASLGASALYVAPTAPPDVWAFVLRTALATPLPRLVLPPYRETVQAALAQLHRREAA